MRNNIHEHLYPSIIVFSGISLVFAMLGDYLMAMIFFGMAIGVINSIFIIK